jgi:hypothetical protein
MKCLSLVERGKYVRVCVYTHITVYTDYFQTNITVRDSEKVAVIAQCH